MDLGGLLSPSPNVGEAEHFYCEKVKNLPETLSGLGRIILAEPKRWGGRALLPVKNLPETLSGLGRITLAEPKVGEAEHFYCEKVKNLPETLSGLGRITLAEPNQIGRASCRERV